MKVGCKHVT